MAGERKSKPARKKIATPFAANLQQVMVERKIALKGAAELAGVTPPVVSGWLSGSMPHDLIAVQRLARALKVNFEWLLTGEADATSVNNLSLSEIFEEQTAFSGVFRIEAKRLIRRGENE